MPIALALILSVVSSGIAASDEAASTERLEIPTQPIPISAQVADGFANDPGAI